VLYIKFNPIFFDGSPARYAVLSILGGFERDTLNVQFGKSSNCVLCCSSRHSCGFNDCRYCVYATINQIGDIKPPVIAGLSFAVDLAHGFSVSGILTPDIQPL
jgi:hypothetical protein